MRVMFFTVGLVVLALGASEAGAMLADVPLAKLVIDADLVVVCEVTGMGPIGKQMLKPPGWPRAVNMTSRTAKGDCSGGSAR